MKTWQKVGLAVVGLAVVAAALSPNDRPAPTPTQPDTAAPPDGPRMNDTTNSDPTPTPPTKRRAELVWVNPNGDPVSFFATGWPASNPDARPWQPFRGGDADVGGVREVPTEALVWAWDVEDADGRTIAEGNATVPAGTDALNLSWTWQDGKAVFRSR